MNDWEQQWLVMGHLEHKHTEGTNGEPTEISSAVS